VSGDITTNTTWTKANSPYQVTADITVQAGVTLYSRGWRCSSSTTLA
jgi:hypothetical protein